MDFEKINADDTLNQGRIKINNILDAAESQVSELKSEIVRNYDVISITEDEARMGYAIDINGNYYNVGSNDWCVSNLYDVNSNKLYISGTIRAASSTYDLLFFNTDIVSSQYLISGINLAAGDTTLKNVEIDVPKGATHFILNIRQGHTSLECQTLRIDRAERAISNVENECLKKKVKMYDVVSEYNSSVINIDGNIGTMYGWSVSKLYPINTDTLYLTGYFQTVTEAYGGNIAFYSNNKISSLYYIESIYFTKSQLENFKINVPDRATYFALNLKDNKSAGYISTDFVYLYENQLQTIISKSSKIVSGKYKKIKLLGDSITHGYGGTGYTNDAEHGDLIFTDYGNSWYVNKNGHCWANLLKEYLESKFSCTVNNFGCTGTSSGQILQHLGDLIAEDDDLIICMIGTNDRNSNGVDVISGQQRNPTQAYYNMQQIYNSVKAMGKEIIFMSNIPASIANETDGKTGHMEDIDHSVMRLAGENNMEYISVYKLFIEYCQNRGVEIDTLLFDGLHPNDNGYDVMFYLICNALGFGTKRPNATW